MQSSGIGAALVRLVAPSGTADLVGELFVPGRVVEADVISVFENRAMLALGRGIRLEVSLQIAVKEGQRLRLQVQPSPGASAGAGRPIVLKLLGTVPQADTQDGGVASGLRTGTSRPAGPGAVGETLEVSSGARGARSPSPLLVGAASADVAASPNPVVASPGPVVASPDVVATPPALTAPQGTAPQAQLVTGQVLWLPISLPQGGQAWVQLAIQEEPERAGRSEPPPPAHQIRIWWETPALGPIQVTLDARATSLTGLFTAQAGGTRSALEAALPDLQRRLTAAGFPDARLGSRQTLPGEAVQPIISSETAGRLDKRM